MTARQSFAVAEARRVGEQVGIDWTSAPFDVEQFRRGMDVELEHGLHDSTTNVTDDDAVTTAKIALAHLNEFSDYYTRLQRMEREAEDGLPNDGPSRGLLDEFLPAFDISDEVAMVTTADVSTAWDALMDADLIELGRRRPLIGALGVMRMLPDLVWNVLHGEHPPTAPERLTLRDTTRLSMSGGGWLLLGERPRQEIALGLVGKFWRPVIKFADVDATAFRDFSEPGFAKTIYALGTRSLVDGNTLLWATMRTATTDAPARTWFRRYWTIGIGSGAHVLAHGLLDAVREDAERRTWGEPEADHG